MLKYNNQFTAYQKYSFNDIDHFSLFGDMFGFFKFKNKHTFLVGRRGEPNYWNTLKSYWMKLDTSINIIAQAEYDYQFFESPLSACWSSSGKIVNFSHGVYYYQTLDSMYFSSHTVDTAGEFSPKKKHMMPGINRKRDNDGFPTLKLSEIPSKDFLVSASYKKNGNEYNMSFFAIFDSTFTTLKKYKKIKRRIYVDVVPLKDGQFAAIEEEYNQFILSETIKTLMESAHKTVRTLAKESGLSPTVIQSMRSGQQGDVKLGNFINISHACGYKIILEKNNERISL